MRAVLALLTIFACSFFGLPDYARAADFLRPGSSRAAQPDAAIGADLFGADGPLVVSREDGGVPGWQVSRADGTRVGYIGSTWEIAKSVGYSGRPLDVLVAITPRGRIAGAKLMQHNEPVLTLGISDEDISAYVSGFAGFDLSRPAEPGVDGLPDVISRATVSTGVIRDGILRTARTLAIGRGILSEAGGIDRIGFKPATWGDLLDMGALGHTRVSMSEAAVALKNAKVQVPPGDGAFLDLFAGLIDPPTVGQNLLGQQGYTYAVGGLAGWQTVLIIISSGLQSHRGTAWRRSGLFERLSIVQGEIRAKLGAADYLMGKRIYAEGAPEPKEISLFRLPKTIDPLTPFRVEVKATRPTAEGGEVSLVIEADYSLPDAFRIDPPPEPMPLWQQAWHEKRIQIGLVLTFLGVLTLILFAQEAITRRPQLWRRGRLTFLALTLVVLGWGLNGQLSVVQVMAFLHSLLGGFRWETFLIEPVIFLLWGFVALGLLFWGRGVYCGWLCPFGALQELLNETAQALGVKQVEVPQAIHERLWVIKYTAFVGLVGLSFYSMHDALVAAEIEPFKTVISLRMIRAWPFVLFVFVLLAAGLFIERFYCRYLCPLGAGLAIPAKLKIFDWLHRRPQCGRECRLCETKCTVGAIDPIGRINANECVLCLRCQMIFNDADTCPTLKRRARAQPQSKGAEE